MLFRLTSFWRDRRGSAAIYTGIVFLALFLAAGAATDIGRAVSVRTQLQRAADSAALAGATAYTGSSAAAAATSAASNYMNGAIAQLRSAGTVTFNVALSTTTTSGMTTDYIVTVTATAKVKTILTTAVTSQLATSVTATADNPVYNIKITLSTFSSSAADGNAVYYYVIPADNGTPAAKTQMFNNFSSACNLKLSLYGQSAYFSSTAAASTVTVTLTAGQKIGFALVNITGCNSFYAANGYGSPFMTANVFYSHMSPPSRLAYPTVAKNCSLQVATTNASTSGSCFATTPALGALSCASAGGTSYYYFWNDMGGGGDDYDYNDAVFKVACTGIGSAYSGVVLTN